LRGFGHSPPLCSEGFYAQHIRKRSFRRHDQVPIPRCRSHPARPQVADRNFYAPTPL
jgi:hypothetical protein